METLPTVRVKGKRWFKQFNTVLSFFLFVTSRSLASMASSHVGQTGWARLWELTLQFDRGRAEDIKEDIDTLLVFVSTYYIPSF